MEITPALELEANKLLMVCNAFFSAISQSSSNINNNGAFACCIAKFLPLETPKFSGDAMYLKFTSL